MQEVLKDVIKEAIAPLFKKEGFMRRGNNFARITPNFSVTANIQASKWNTQDEIEFCFNTGIYMEELFGKVFIPETSFSNSREFSSADSRY